MRPPHATGAPTPQGPRNEGEIQASAGWQDAMYGSHGMVFGNNPAVLRGSAASGGQATGHGPQTNDGDFNTHSTHGDQSIKGGA